MKATTIDTSLPTPTVWRKTDPSPAHPKPDSSVRPGTRRLPITTPDPVVRPVRLPPDPVVCPVPGLCLSGATALFRHFGT
ncbi:hypothetical protein C5167_008672 [Papaver somniferum]|uniref:Uncharacterized protein n=1 Tax=Papaver somniferum TaxID=3469 RepID=A0A4Y7JZ55_PAPSO|nr:hypothetical protein C5167_008672 [Papaver somniferum]